MKKPKDNAWTLIVWYICVTAVILGVVAVVAVLSSCEVLKKKSSIQKDTTAVVKTDSGKVTVNTNNSKDSAAWWREIINFGRDTTIINPVTNVYPTSYIREGGTRTIETKEINYDSLWKNKVDSLAAKLSEENKSKETKVLTQWYIWVILGLVALIAFKLFFKLK